MPKVTIELEYEQLDAMVLHELKHCYEQLLRDWDNKVNVYDTRDELWTTMAAFERVLEYFMVGEDYDRYMASFSTKSLSD
ncbi:hypothetical protein UFOVP247_192 [uncultured Caudovirales phage]|uniref:Uncharacterized protein n=1 Tax=uncultured Caudovirales phage TaxID=2100421 RepID=A0A6J7WXE4_9CAUD|nr:hypothetical protein UFOVP247_192 [uncultured Caudovirales phage]